MVFVLFCYNLYFLLLKKRKYSLSGVNSCKSGLKIALRWEKWDLVMEMGRIYANRNAQAATWHDFRHDVTLPKSQTLLGDALWHHLTVLLAGWADGSLLICIDTALFQTLGWFASFGMISTPICIILARCSALICINLLHRI